MDSAKYSLLRVGFSGLTLDVDWQAVKAPHNNGIAAKCNPLNRKAAVLLDVICPTSLFVITHPAKAVLPLSTRRRHEL